MDSDVSPFSEPIASTSRAVFTLPYKPQEDDEEDQALFSDPLALELYQQAWSACNARIQSTLSGLHDASLDQIVSFVHASRNDDPSLYAALSGRTPLRTGLILGASPGSSSLLFSSLIRQLTRPLTPSSSSAASPSKPCIVSRLTSRDFSNIKNALRSLIAGFVGSDIEIEMDEEDEDDEGVGYAPRTSTLKSALLVPEDMLNLTAWYEHRFGKKEKDNAPTLVVLLEDLEATDGKVLTLLLETLSHFTSILPLILLIGVATSPSALHSLIPSPVANRLDLASFYVDPGVGAFNALVRGVFVDWQAPLALGPRAYTELWRAFEDLSHSIDATVSTIQYLYMDHFTSQPHAFLTLAPSPAVLASLPPSTPSAIRCLPSLVSPASSSASSPLLPILLSPTTPSTDFYAAIESCRADLEAWYGERSVAFECVWGMMDFWEKRRGLETVLGMLLGEQGGGAGLGKVTEDLCGLVLQASSTKLPLFLRSLTSRLTAFSSSHPTHPTSLLTFLSSQLAALQPILDAPRPAGRSNLINSHLAGGALALPGFGGLRGAGGLTQGDRDFSRIAKETADGLKSRLKAALRPCTDLLLHELWFTDDTSASKRFHPAPLPTLLRTLAKLDPYSSPTYSAEEESDTLPLDLAVAYRTYKETHVAGRLVNLGEWWSAWELGAGEEPEGTGNGGGGKGKKGRRNKRAREEEEDDEEEDDEDEEDEGDEGPQRRKQARFLRAVGDLAHLGFVLPTTRKPEHLLKCVY
ncbi:hypothetical protein JCM5296_005129 [Sporobolomyces johnsonii]